MIDFERRTKLSNDVISRKQYIFSFSEAGVNAESPDTPLFPTELQYFPWNQKNSDLKTKHGGPHCNKKTTNKRIPSTRKMSF